MAVEVATLWSNFSPCHVRKADEEGPESLQWRTSLLYQEDVIVFSKDFERHLEWLAKVC